MKRVLFLILLTGLSNIIIAQDWIVPQTNLVLPAHEFRFGVGYKPFEAAKAFENLFNWGDSFWDKQYIHFDTKSYYSGARFTTNAIFGEYTYQANKWMGVGVTAVYFSYFSNYFDEQTDNPIGINLIQHFSVYPTLRFTWLNKPGFSLYSSVGVGMRFVHEFDNYILSQMNNTSVGIAGQFTLFGFTVGKNIYGFSDLSSFGTQGIGTIGIGYRIQSNAVRR